MLKIKIILFFALSTLTCLSVCNPFNNWNATAIREKLCDKDVSHDKIDELEKCARMCPKEHQDDIYNCLKKLSVNGTTYKDYTNTFCDDQLKPKFAACMNSTKLTKATRPPPSADLVKSVNDCRRKVFESMGVKLN